MRRREFLIEGGRAALGASLLPLGGGPIAPQKSRSPRDIFLESRIAEWERNSPQWLQDVRLPGVAMLLIDDGKVFWQREFGVKDAVSKAPVDKDTVFAACSNTKPVFAYAVAKLCEKGVMDLDTPLTNYTSRRFLEGDPRLDLITARHVLTHSTGFPNWRNGRELTIQFTPGTRAQYSGEGFSYLQSVVQEVTRQPFADFMRINILEPFGMTSSRIVGDESYKRRMARGHDQNGKPIEQGPPQTAEKAAEDLAIYGAAAALSTTTTDFAKFMIEILDPKPADAFRLSASGLREYLRPQLKRDEIKSSSLGWVVAQTNGLSIFSHSGSAPGWYCDAYGSANRKSGIVIMSNGDNLLPFHAKLKLDLEFFTHLAG